MFRRLVLSVALVAVLAFSQIGTAQARSHDQSVGICDTQTVVLGNGYHSIYMICMPAAVPWNKQLVVFAHGYVPNLSADPILPVNQLTEIGGISLSDTINSMGYAFAMTSYPVNGLAILPGVLDVVNLVQTFKGLHSDLNKVFLTGASEGGLVATLGVEKYPAIFKGGLAVCGPIGNFQNQVNYFGDFRVLFDYYFPGILPVSGPPDNYSAINIPTVLTLDWAANPDKYLGLIATAFAANPIAVKELYQVAKVPVDPASPVNSAVGLLWYNVFATMDARMKMSVNPPQELLNPYDNANRWYFGSSNDSLLNRSVPRFMSTVPIPIMNQYQTSGKLSSPLVTMHTTGDPIVPYWHETLYTLKTLQSGSFFKRVNIPISRYGHCALTAKEVIFGFALMVYKATGSLPLNMLAVLADGGTAPVLTEQEFWQMRKALAPNEVYVPMVGR